MLKLPSSLLLAALVATAACATTGYGPGAHGAHPPPLPAGSTLGIWEHYCVNPNSAGDFNTVLAEAGAAGWEMIGVGINTSNLLVCFKRPGVRPSAPASPPPPPAAEPGAPASAG